MEGNGDKAQVMVSELNSSFIDEVSEHLRNLDLARCFQCGTCSGSCPTLESMEYGPRKIMRMIHLGMTDEVLRSKDIWYCVSCFSCAARCPQGIPIADVMAALRNLSIAKGVATDKEATFSRVFLDVLTRYGRMFEPEVLARYYASEFSVPALLKLAPVGLKMFTKGKIGLRPERIESAAELKEICLEGEEKGGEES